MNPPSTELIAPEEAAKLGAHANPPVSIVLTAVEKFGLPTSVYASNVRAMRRIEPNLMCHGVVTNTPLEWNKEMVIVEAMAPLLGFYNHGVDEDGKPVLVAAYGKPTLTKAWRVAVGPTLQPTAYLGAFHYESVVFYIRSEIKA